MSLLQQMIRGKAGGGADDGIYQALLDAISETGSEVEADMRSIGEYIFSQVDTDDDNRISGDERKRFLDLIKISATTAVSEEPDQDRRQKKSIISFADLRGKGIVNGDDVKFEFCDGKDNANNGKKVFAHFEGKQYRVFRAVTKGRSTEGHESLRELTQKYLDLKYAPQNYTDYWRLEGTTDSLSALVAKYRANWGS